jgi:hypothetical protein
MSTEGLIRINIAKIKQEAKEISKQVEKGIITGLNEKYSNFSSTYPVLFKNMIEKKMTFEEVDILLDTFDRAQNHFIDNFNKDS